MLAISNSEVKSKLAKFQKLSRGSATSITFLARADLRTSSNASSLCRKDASTLKVSINLAPVSHCISAFSGQFGVQQEKESTCQRASVRQFARLSSAYSRNRRQRLHQRFFHRRLQRERYSRKRKCGSDLHERSRSVHRHPSSDDEHDG